MRRVEDRLTFPHDRVHVKDIPGDEPLDQVKRPTIAERLDRGPELVLTLETVDPDGRGVRPRLQHPGRRHPFGKPPNRGVIHDMDEIGDEDAVIARADAHRQLVAEVAGGRLAHAGHAQVLAQQGRGLDVEVVERDDAVERPRARQMADAFQQILPRDVARDVKGLVDRLARPVGILQGVDGEQQDACSPDACTRE